MANLSQRLRHGKALCGKVFAGFVETFNSLVDFKDNLKGDGDGGIGHIRLDRRNPAHPVIRCRGCEQDVSELLPWNTSVKGGEILVYVPAGSLVLDGSSFSASSIDGLARQQSGSDNYVPDDVDLPGGNSSVTIVLEIKTTRIQSQGSGGDDVYETTVSVKDQSDISGSSSGDTVASLTVIPLAKIVAEESSGGAVSYSVKQLAVGTLVAVTNTAEDESPAEVAVDEESVDTNDDDEICIFGYGDASVGDVLMRTQNGVEWRHTGTVDVVVRSVYDVTTHAFKNYTKSVVVIYGSGGNAPSEQESAPPVFTAISHDADTASQQ